MKSVEFFAILWKLIRRKSMDAIAERLMTTEQTFADIYQEHHRRVLNLCSYLLNSQNAAEDAAHEIFMRAQRRIETYDPALPFSSWIMKVASNYCIDILRRRGLEKRLFGVDDPESLNLSSTLPSPLSQVLTAEQSKIVRRALASLPDNFRVPIVLAYYNEFNYDQIAAVLQIPRNTVATLLFRGKQLLRQKLKKEKHHEVPE
ncbi:MAG TPA: RNA polymerase sigma factor [Acidobacteriota bacterium]|nr:RNA polymerase sigma factor [Acidobacteriota bacterium]